MDYFLNKEFEDNIRNNHFDLWNDLLMYGENLNGNWLISQEVFRKNIVPTAENDPKQFAKWVDTMVKTSGIKIKSRHAFAKSLKLLRKLKSIGRFNRNELSSVVTELLNSGINQPEFAQNALNTKFK